MDLISSSTAFLRRLLSFSANFTPAKSERLAPEQVQENELLARYIFSDRHYSKSTSAVKPDAFLPHGSPLQTSVFRVDGLAVEGVWQIGEAIAEQRGRGLKARADFEARALAGTPLKLEADDTPPRHANILGWPSEKADQLQLAIEIAAKAALHLAPKT